MVSGMGKQQTSRVVRFTVGKVHFVLRLWNTGETTKSGQVVRYSFRKIHGHDPVIGETVFEGKCLLVSPCCKTFNVEDNATVMAVLGFITDDECLSDLNDVQREFHTKYAMSVYRDAINRFDNEKEE